MQVESDTSMPTSKNQSSVMKSKSLWLIVAGISLSLLLLAIVAFFFIQRQFQQPAAKTITQPKKRKLSQPLNVIPLQKRPYLSISPEVDGHHLVIHIDHLVKGAASAEYELEYQTGSMLQGAFGEIQLAQLPARETVFLGSCSAGGACTYHENIKGGSLLTRFKGEHNYALKSDFRFYETQKMTDTTFASRDAKFRLTSTDLIKNKYVIIFNGAGIPKADKLKGEILSDPFIIAVSGHLKGDASELSILTRQPGATAIAGWDGQNWRYFPVKTNVGSKTIDLKNLPLMKIYLAMKR